MQHQSSILNLLSFFGRYSFYTISFFSLLCIISACTQFNASSFPEAPTIIADCGWFALGRVYFDQNQNGQQEPTERPIADIPFHIDDILNNYSDVGFPAKSNGQGESKLMVFIAGCPATKMEVSIDVPKGYRLTTPARLSETISQTYEFGLAAIDAQ